MSLPIYQRVAVTDAGDVIPGAEYTVINENTGVAAPIYSDRTGATLLTAPYFADSVGTIQFFIAQGTTFRVAASGGVGTYTDRYVYGVAEAVLVQADGNVGIGNSDPAVPLDVRKAGGGNFIANFQNTTAATPYCVSIKDAVGGANGYPLFQVTNSAGSVAHLKVVSGTGNVSVSANINLNANDTYVGFPSNGIYYNNSADHVSVKTGATERMRIDSSGRLLLNASSAIFSASEALHIEGIEAGTASYAIFAHGSAETNYFVRAYIGENLSGYIYYTDNGLYLTTVSDERLKENISNANDAGERIDAINVRQFDWKQSGDHQEYGMIAQELIKVAPDAVHAPEDPEDMMGVDYAKLVPMLIKEVQSLRARVAALESN